MEKRQNELVAKLADAKVVAVKQQASQNEPSKNTGDNLEPAGDGGGGAYPLVMVCS